MKKVMVFGTFDTLHRGHLFFLDEAAKFGEELIVVLAPDRTVGELKGRTPLESFDQRKSKLLARETVTKVLPSDEVRGSWEVVSRERPQVICLGHDQTAMEESLLPWIDGQGDYNPEIVRLTPYRRHLFSTTAEIRRRKILFYALLTLSMSLMAFSWVSGKWLTREAPLFVLIFWRFLFSLVPFIPYRQGLSSLNFSRKAILFTLLSACSLFLYNVLFFRGLEEGWAGKGGVMVTTLTPLFTVMISGKTKREKRGNLVSGLILGLAGGIIFLEPWVYRWQGLWHRGNFYFIAASLCWSLLTLSSSRALRETDIKKFNFLLYTLVTLMSLPFAFPEHPFALGELSLSFWINILYLSLMVTSLATSLYFAASHRIGPTRANSFTFLIPFMALIFSFLFLKEIPSPATLSGGVFALAALLFINHKKGKTHE